MGLNESTEDASKRIIREGREGQQRAYNSLVTAGATMGIPLQDLLTMTLNDVNLYSEGYTTRREHELNFELAFIYKQAQLNALAILSPKNFPKKFKNISLHEHVIDKVSDKDSLFNSLKALSVMAVK